MELALNSGFRLSGRGFLEARKIKVEFGPGLGDVEVRLGAVPPDFVDYNGSGRRGEDGGDGKAGEDGEEGWDEEEETIVYACVDASLVVPAAERPNAGQILIQAQSSRACAPDVSERALSDAHITQMLDRLVRGSRVIDPEALCVLAGNAAWKLHLRVRILKDRGSCLDACALAALASLMSFKRRRIDWASSSASTTASPADAAGQAVSLADGLEDTQIPLLSHPFLFTFAVLPDKGGQGKDGSGAPAILADCSAVEEQILHTRVSVAVNVAGDVFLVEKSSGASVSPDTILACVDAAVQQVKDSNRILATHLQRYLSEQQAAAPTARSIAS